jgi:hypothetical protein
MQVLYYSRSPASSNPRNVFTMIRRIRFGRAFLIVPIIPPPRLIQLRQHLPDKCPITNRMQVMVAANRSSESTPAQFVGLILSSLPSPSLLRRIGPTTQSTARAMGKSVCRTGTLRGFSYHLVPPLQAFNKGPRYRCSQVVPFFFVNSVCSRSTLPPPVLHLVASTSSRMRLRNRCFSRVSEDSVGASPN